MQLAYGVSGFDSFVLMIMIKQLTVNFDLRETIQYEQRGINNVKMKIYEIGSRHICSDV